MMKTTWAILASVCICGLSALCAEEKADQPFISSVSIGAGMTLHDDINIYRLAVRKDSKYTFLENPTGWLSGYYEASLGCWSKKDELVCVGAISPVFVYYFGEPTWTVQPYIEAGIGVSCISDTRIATRDLATAFQFEDRVGAGVKIKYVDISARYMHYSNASIAAPNNGMDIFIATVGYCF
ncbi:MAG: acyloxyacyl hydrolase [bacterium]